MDESELTLRRQEASRGTSAKRILEDDVFKDAVTQLRDRALEAFKHAKPGDAEALCVARLEYEVTERLISRLATVLETGSLAEKQLSAFEKGLAFVTRKRRYAA